MLFGFLFILIVVLWIVDAVETLIVVRRLGCGAELNPFARFLLKHNKEDFILFKLIDLVVVLTILYFLCIESEEMAMSLLVSFFAVYLFVVVHNFKVIKTLKNKKDYTKYK